MDVYHKVLLRLYQVTGGKDSQTVDLKDLIKGLGFLGNYNDIAEMLSGQGWIVETPKVNYVRITHWGVKEINKSAGSAPDSGQILKKAAANLIADTRQLTILLEEFAADVSKENFNQVDKKLSDMKTVVDKLRPSVE